MTTSTAERCWIRDVPASCICWWDYLTGPARWERTRPRRDCPWHVSYQQGYQQAARLLENLHERHTGKMTRR